MFFVDKLPYIRYHTDYNQYLGLFIPLLYRLDAWQLLWLYNKHNGIFSIFFFRLSLDIRIMKNNCLVTASMCIIERFCLYLIVIFILLLLSIMKVSITNKKKYSE